jgi:chromate transporter
MPPGTKEERKAGGPDRPEPTLPEIVSQWGRIGCIGFGGPPAHIVLLRDLCVTRRRWLTAPDFERALAATNILPGPSSTQLAIYCAWRLHGGRGAIVGGLSFILPGLIAILGLAALFLAGSPPAWVQGAGMGAGAAIAPVAAHAGIQIGAPIWRRSAGAMRIRVAVYALASATVSAISVSLLVLVLLGAGVAELCARGLGPRRAAVETLPLLAAAGDPAGLPALLWMALKVGALAFGGGFVIVPLMEANAVGAGHWMSHGQFLNAVALGQITPGPLVQTVAAVGYAAGGLGWGLAASAVAFLPSFSFILIGAARFERLLGDGRALAFLGGAAPAAAGAIIGSAVPLAGGLAQGWQFALLGLAGGALFLSHRGTVATILGCGLLGVLAALLGAPLSLG